MINSAVDPEISTLSLPSSSKIPRLLWFYGARSNINGLFITPDTLPCEKSIMFLFQVPARVRDRFRLEILNES